MVEIQFWLNCRFRSLFRLLNIPTFMLWSWFPQRYSSSRDFKSAKVPGSIVVILFWLRKRFTRLFRFWNDPASMVESWFPDRYSASKDLRSANGPSSTAGILFWTRDSSTRLFRFWNKPASMLESWFCHKYNISRDFRSAKLPGSTVVILFWLRERFTRLFRFWNNPASMLESWFPHRYSASRDLRSAKVPGSKVDILFLYRWSSSSETIPLNASLCTNESWLWSISSRLHRVRWLKTPEGTEVMELHPRKTLWASAGMSWGTWDRPAQVLQKCRLELKNRSQHMRPTRHDWASTPTSIRRTTARPDVTEEINLHLKKRFCSSRFPFQDTIERKNIAASKIRMRYCKWFALKIKGTTPKFVSKIVPQYTHTHSLSHTHTHTRDPGKWSVRFTNLFICCNSGMAPDVEWPRSIQNGWNCIHPILFAQFWRISRLAEG